MSIDSLKDEILSLPASEKAKLIDMLWDSLSKPELKRLEGAWAAESERRIDAFEFGKLRSRGAGSVLNELKRALSH